MIEIEYELKNGIKIYMPYRENLWHIAISEKSNIWEQPPTLLKQTIEEAKKLIPYADVASTIEWFLFNNGDKFVNNHSGAIIEEYYSILINYENNPFVDEEQKIILKSILEEYVHSKKRKTLIRNSSYRLRTLVILRDNSICQYCNIKLYKKHIHIDHIIPYSLGGRTELENLVVACPECNLKKSGHTLEEANMKLITEKDTHENIRR